MSEGPAREVEVSKLLSYVLRHKPEAIGLELDAGGWVAVDTLLAHLAASGRPVSRTEIDRTVETSDKQRFALSEDQQRIRANQGHSVAVDLGLPSAQPPSRLFHGTATRFEESIRREGLKPAQRHHVHLSASPGTAQVVGARHGKPLVLVVNAEAMHKSGFKFFISANGVWLTDHVPPQFLLRASEA